MQDQHNRRPKNRRVNYERLSSDNPFIVKYDKILKSPSDLIPVLEKGVPQRYSFIYFKVDEPKEDKESWEDIEMDNDEEEEEETTPPPSKRIAIDGDFVPLLTTLLSDFTKFVPMSRLFEVEIKPKLSRGMKRRAKKKAEKRGEITVKDERNVEKSKDFKIPQLTAIGRIVRSLRWSSRHGNKLGFGYCFFSDLEPLLKNYSVVYFRNPASHK